ncbi:MAG: hypothetical protein H0T89_29395 [Deltaproteobacteria bacterium]|nr:hypothetical protein [Deltaproteobacteria bacterium]MDQ3297075.1 hypothetical protein [Myxococcota bacterium]
MKSVSFTCALVMSLQLGCGAEEETFTPWELEDLSADQGFSLRVPEFDVAAGRESQNCYFVRVPDLGGGEDIWVDRVLTAINPGSHHMNVFRVKTILGLDPAAGTPVMLGAYEGTVIEGEDFVNTSPCWNSTNWADWPLVANSQHATVEEAKTDWQLPESVAIRMTPGEMLMIQTHYVNTTDQPTRYGAKVGINFYRHQGTSPMEMGSLFATQQNLRVCKSRPNVTYSGTCRFPGAVTITAANGHFHKRGDTFTIFPWDGQSIDHPAESTAFYQSDSWEEPPMAMNLDVKAAANTGIWWDCAFKWTPPTHLTCAEVDAKDPLQENDCCYTFGGNTDVGEHCNVFLYYYPKVNSDIFCL